MLSAAGVRRHLRVFKGCKQQDGVSLPKWAPENVKNAKLLRCTALHGTFGPFVPGYLPLQDLNPNTPPPKLNPGQESLPPQAKINTSTSLFSLPTRPLSPQSVTDIFLGTVVRGLFMGGRAVPPSGGNREVSSFDVSPFSSKKILLLFNLGLWLSFDKGLEVEKPLDNGIWL